ncbi:hypothetical protein WICPIJ_004529 [Wickerhamomyces pijperi]|uniref:Uncharacterized protein n=1 Tax=Wickerhamomyces pijperi TaxID=599730 RepID=A0A9P8TMN8_WICPI|nr:hypothetical protein WICPIJ_004529 [Wickerhamomyces pijperi]
MTVVLPSSALLVTFFEEQVQDVGSGCLHEMEHVILVDSVVDDDLRLCCFTVDSQGLQMGLESLVVLGVKVLELHLQGCQSLAGCQLHRITGNGHNPASSQREVTVFVTDLHPVGLGKLSSTDWPSWIARSSLESVEKPLLVAARFGVVSVRFYHQMANTLPSLFTSGAVNQEKLLADDLGDRFLLGDQVIPVVEELLVSLIQMPGELVKHTSRQNIVRLFPILHKLVVGHAFVLAETYHTLILLY